MIFLGLVGRGIAAADVELEELVVQVGRREVTRPNQEDGAGGRGGADDSVRGSDVLVSVVNLTFFGELPLGVRARHDGVRGSGTSSDTPVFEDAGAFTSEETNCLASSSRLLMSSSCMKWWPSTVDSIPSSSVRESSLSSASKVESSESLSSYV